MEKQLNNQILERESANIGVEIEPEPMYLVSKDTNNRIELTEDWKIIGAGGGTTGCRKGPNPSKALSHPAIIDWALSEYLTACARGDKGLSMDKPFDETLGMEILQSTTKEFKPVKWMMMFQNVLASSPGSNRYIFGMPTDDENCKDPIIMHHYNRVFYMKDNTENCMHLHSAFARVITDATIRKRKRDNQREIMIDPLALKVFQANGAAVPPGKDIMINKVTNLEDTWYVFLLNKDLNRLTPEEYWFIRENLDYTKYLGLLRDGFENNWRNQLPERSYVKFYDLNDCVTIKTYRKDGHVSEMPASRLPNRFLGWNTKEDGSGEYLTEGTPVAANSSVYAVYRETA